jgi:hypothetical protein
MNSQRGKVSTNASRQNKSQKQRQASKSQTNARRNNNHVNRPKPQTRRVPQDLRFKQGGSGRLGLSSSNSARVQKSHLIDEDEYITDINGSVAFATTQFSINPGQSGTFPWGYKIAGLYEKYNFQYLEFYYTREVSEYSTNGQAGKVMLSVDFDASDGAPTTKQQVLDTVPHEDGMPCKERISLIVPVNELNNQDSKYVRPGAQPANTDIKTYDAGNLFVSTYGNTNTTVIGELRVRYRVLVSVPILESAAAPSGQPGSYLQLSSSLLGETAAATTVFAPLFASATSPVVVANGIGATIASTGLITLLPGVYLIECCNSFSDTAATVSAGRITIGQSAVAATDLSYNSSDYGFETADGSDIIIPHATWFAGCMPSTWNTSLYGLNICLQASGTYASGTCLNQGYLKITQL